MRKLKFRAWSEEQKKLIQGYPLGEDQKNGFTVCGVSENGEQETTSDGLVLMQFTGLVDKNGKEIYEKDILLCDEEIMLVTWNNEQTGFWPFTTRIGNLFERLKSGYEVIGNVFENPEIL